ncbi:MAG: tyrosine-type recombinase/integrase [Thermoguttaceae bacterium]|nr:tyrosine-type recombinase/integrase [Thermoguttaceae bacterium]
MAQFSTRYQGKGRGKRATKFQIASMVFATSITLSADMYDEADAQDCRNILNEIERLRQVGSPLSVELIRRIDGRPHFKIRLAEKGIIDVKDEITLGELWEMYFKAKNADWGYNTASNKTSRRAAFFRFFDETQLAKEIDESDVKRFETFLLTRGQANGAPYSEAGKAGVIKDCKAVFAFAVDEGFLTRSPFGKIKSGKMVNRDRDRYITPEETEKLLNACDVQEHWTEERRQEWRVLIALCRFCGLRCPSEIDALKWSDVDFKRGRLDVDDVKNKRRRVCPMFAPVRVELERLREIRGDKAGVFVVESLRTVSHLRTTFPKLIYRAGLEPWSKPFQNLRSSASTDVSNKYGAKCESDWLGHGADVSLTHYQQIPPETVERALNDDWGLVCGPRPR